KKISIKYYIYLFIIFILLLFTFIYLYQYNEDLLVKLIGNSFYYRVNRILSYKESYQMDMALTNIYSVSFIRNGFNKILLYIPEGVTDFIFAFSIGNFGYLMFFIIITIYLFLIYNLFGLIKKYNDKKTNYLIISFIIMLFFNILINVLMNIGLIPIIGITLPFLSYGGSSLILYFLYIGIIFNLTTTDKC
ncbi:MAG: FtsW/RodA/SpoVE family cell cycle protein, partial [Bacilli bacterium]